MLGITYPFIDCEQIGYTETECTLYISLENVTYTLKEVKFLKQPLPLDVEEIGFLKNTNDEYRRNTGVN